MVDTPGNNGDQPEPTDPSYPEQASPVGGEPAVPAAPAYQPKWAPQAPAAPAPQSWAPQAPAPSAPAPQDWAPQAPAAPAYQPQSWPPQAPAPAAPAYQQQPWAPQAPIQPADPSQPWAPQAPIQPADPSQPWAPQAPIQPADPSQPWAPQFPAQPGADASQPWAPQAPSYPYGQPQAPKASKRRFVLPIICVLLVIALVATAGFSFVTISKTNKDLEDTKAFLSSEQAAHQVANTQINSLNGCIAAMKTDEGSLKALQIALSTTQSRVGTSGDVDAARVAYEDELLTATTDLLNGSLAMNHAATTAAYNAAVIVLQRGQSEMQNAETLKATLDSMITSFGDDMDSNDSQATTLAAQLTATVSLCTTAGAGVSPAPVATPTPSTH
jgi:hypothetical protein